ncbi:hypothetical protein AB0I49_31645 [Streptomyces sp. NPDC050617]|uniref:HAD family hydrolase n=1 Tax=Streptomyces sp. NPDC050617 TaxID=3154628 RepID=UPI0034121595
MSGGPGDRIDTVFLDVNGTLVPSVPRSGAADPRTSVAFREGVRALRSAGVRVGLCSDSPLEQLWEFGRAIGLGTPPDFPVIAENGNVAADGTVRVMTPFSRRTAIAERMAELARQSGLRRVADVLAPEFGGSAPAAREWGFGANRRASLSLFGPADFIESAIRHLTEWALRDRWELSVDISPARTFAGLHPYSPTRLGKRRAFAELAAAGERNMLMVGDSAADWIPDVPGVRSAFVAHSDVPAEAATGAWHFSDRPVLAGVIDILGKVTELQLAQQR